MGVRHFTPSGVRHLSPRNLTPTGIDVSLRERFVAASGPNDPPRARLREGDILLSNSGVASVGRPALFWGFRGDYTIAQHINRIQVAGIDPFYVTAYLHTSFARTQIRRFQSGTGAAGISFAQIRALKIPVPPAAAQAAVRHACEAMHAAHLASMAARDEPGRLDEARALLADLVRRLEAYLLDPGEEGFV